MHFETPALFFLGLAGLALALLLKTRLRPLLKADLPLGAPGGEPFRPPLNLSLLLRCLAVLECGAVLLLCAAAAGPTLTVKERAHLKRGPETLFLLDTSPSMAALDMNGKSRFETAKTFVRSFADARPQDALGLAGLGDEAALLTPPSVDRRAFFERLDTLRIGE
ncbi:MAG: VWA domain-containing protein, partial [Treponema sp.]|nr:VWA domain-containing protein [Treponema sp.]